MMILAIDFNGVLCNRKIVPQGKKLGAPIDGARDALVRLHKQGHKLYIFTDMADSTEGYNAVQDWLDYFEMPWDYITNTKVKKVDYFIDDKAIHFDNWMQVLIELGLA